VNQSDDSQHRRLGLTPAIAVVVANMIGTGVFISAGYMVGALDAQTMLIAWLVGGILALCGASIYAELGAMMPRVGGEYVYLKEALHPAVGFLSGWVSLIAGFSAPIAAASLAFGNYYAEAEMPGLGGEWAAMLLIAVLTFLHMGYVALGSAVQTGFTILKVLLITGFIIAGFTAGDGSFDHLSITMEGASSSIFSEVFAVQLFWVAFAYSGWNAAAYIAGEMKDPGKNLPRALLIGTGIVTVLYLLLNLVFLYAAPPGELFAPAHEYREVGTSASIALFGESAGAWVSRLIAFALISTVSAMIMAGPRVYAAMAEDRLFFGFLSRRHHKGGPMFSVLLQGAIAIALVQLSSLPKLIDYIGFTLSIFAALTVVGAFVLRRTRPDARRPYRTFGWPVTPVLFLGLSLWMIVQGIRQRPEECGLYGGITLGSGLVLYAVWRALGNRGVRVR
jgi:APA family basic amino acid/polyamine antiporter